MNTNNLEYAKDLLNNPAIVSSKLAEEPTTVIQKKENVIFIRVKDLISSEDLNLPEPKLPFYTHDTNIVTLHKEVFNHNDYKQVKVYSVVEEVAGKKSLKQTLMLAWTTSKVYLLVLANNNNVANPNYQAIPTFKSIKVWNLEDLNNPLPMKRIPTVFYDRVVILPTEEETNADKVEQTESGIYIPSEKRKTGKYGEKTVDYVISYEYGYIVGFGNGDLDRTNGKRLPMECDILQKVVIPPNYANPYFLDGVEYRIVRDSDIFAVVEW